MKLRGTRGHASAHQLGKVLADFDWETPGLVSYADESSAPGEIRLAFEKAPQMPIAGTPTATAMREESRADLLFLGDASALRAVDILPENPQEAWGVFRSSRIAVFGIPKRIQMDGCEVRARRNEP